MNPKELPVYKERAKILQALKDHQIIVVESPTGSGKTTQIPLILHQAGYAKKGTIGITQPRRIAAISVCEYIAKQIGSEIPGKTGYKLRFDDQTAPETEIKIMTDGILLQELKADKLLRKYSVIMVDEAHERSLNIDFTLGLLKQILAVRKDFRVIISSATINASIFADYFSGAPIIRIKTPVYPVEEIYMPLKQATSFRQRSSEAVTEAIVKVVGKELQQAQRTTGRSHEAVATHEANHIKEGATNTTECSNEVVASESMASGDILIFLPGERDIKETVQALANAYGEKLFILPLYGRLSKEEQNRVFTPTPVGKKKVVVSTNIAETSVTIDGITTVIDPGIAKINYYNPRTYISSLIETPISQAAAKQRRGRAGRTQPGRCYRLYSNKQLESRPRYTQEEIYRTDLSEVLLRMAELGITNFDTFDFISKPEKLAIASARETLLQLKAIQQDNSLSSIGETMARFPLLPRHSRAVVAAMYEYPQVLHETLVGISFLSTKSPYLLPHGEEMAAREAQRHFADKRGDFFSYLRLFNAFDRCKDTHSQERFANLYYLDLKIMQEILNIRKQLGDILSEMNVPILQGGSPDTYIQAIATGMTQWICKKLPSGLYRSISVHRIVIHPSSVLFRSKPQYIVAGEIFKTSKTFACSVSSIKPAWIKELSPRIFTQLNESTGWIEKQQQLADKRKERKNTTSAPHQSSFGAENRPIQKETQPLRLLGKEFAVVRTERKKSFVEIPLQELAPLVKKGKKLPKTPHFYRGTLLFQGYQLQKEEKISHLLKIIPHLAIDTQIRRKPPQGNYQVSDTQKLPQLVHHLTYVMRLAPVKPKSNTLGFITLESDGKDNCWFTSRANYFHALETTLYSLEVLADKFPKKQKRLKTQVNKLYRTLLTIYES